MIRLMLFLLFVWIVIVYMTFFTVTSELWQVIIRYVDVYIDAAVGKPLLAFSGLSKCS